MTVSPALSVFLRRASRWLAALAALGALGFATAAALMFFWQPVGVIATDSQGVAKISLEIDGKEVAVSYGSQLGYSWNTRNVASGAHTVTVRITDVAGNVTTRTVTVYK